MSAAGLLLSYSGSNHGRRRRKRGINIKGKRIDLTAEVQVASDLVHRDTTF